MCFCSSMDA
ncbi:hypothetical protein OIU79_013849, partial [Salix purpurea]